MIRNLIRLFFCLCLPPLLIAQENASPQALNPTAAAGKEGYVTIPRDSEVELVLLDRVTSETAAAGDTVRFAVAKDLVVNGVRVLRAGTPVPGVVVKARPAIAGKQDAELKVRVKQVPCGANRALPLTVFDPKYRQARGEAFREASAYLLIFVAGLALAIVLLPWFLFFLNGTRADARADATARAPKRGADQSLVPQCFVQSFFVESSLRVPIEEIPSASTETTAYFEGPCSQPGFKVDLSKVNWGVIY